MTDGSFVQKLGSSGNGGMNAARMERGIARDFTGKTFITITKLDFLCV